MIFDEDDARAWLARCPEYDGVAASRIARLVDMLREENARQNLVASTSLSAVWARHIVDSAQLLQYVPRETASWLDLGTGAGFPGIVVAILLPQCRVILSECRARRVQWLETLANALELPNVEVRAGRVESMVPFTADAISARAFAPLERLIPLAAKFSTSSTTWVLPKGRSARDELASLQDWQHTFHVEQSLTDADAGVIVGRLIGSRKKRR